MNERTSLRRPWLTAGTPMYGPQYDFLWVDELRRHRKEVGAVPISAVIYTLNEEVALPDALASVGWCDEIVVIDMHSEDRTAAIAREAGARVVFLERAGHSDLVRNFGPAQATHESVKGWPRHSPPRRRRTQLTAF